ncbi:ATP-grasp domain-containing protein [Longispora albida]|uniref:ATP-grasp domain-containing protein n=1 Tax=Longispora albida TaxID=203523 RepID=UPI0003668FBC|nr:ATP-grasp domain-containing protein [Longispora albida]
MDHRPLVLVLRTGTQDAREYLLRSMSTRYRLHLVSSLDPSWEREYLDGWTIHDSRDPAQALAVAAGIEGVSGVLTWDEARVTQVAHIADGLRLPGAGQQAAQWCREKNLTRRALDAAGVPQPRSVSVSGADQAVAAAATIGYPVVIKPNDLLASMGVIRAADEEELRAAYTQLTGYKVGGLPDYVFRPLVEECVTGEEISVDSVLFEGELTVLCVARKTTGYPPYFAEVQHMVDSRDPLLADAELHAFLQAAHQAVGYSSGVTHTEIMLTAEGPKIIEINGRLGSGLIPYLALEAIGVDIGLAACDTACGVRPVLGGGLGRVAGIRFLHPEQPGTVVESIRFDEAALDPAVVSTFLYARPGSVVSPPDGSGHGRIGYAVAVAGSAEECQAALDSAEAALLINK